MSTTIPATTRRRVGFPVPFHSWKSIPHRLLKVMMKAMWMVQLEKSYLPIWVVPIP